MSGFAHASAAEVARRIREAHAAALTGAGPRPETLCRLALIDAVEEATDYEIDAAQAGRIADAVLRLIQRGPCGPGGIA